MPIMSRNNNILTRPSGGILATDCSNNTNPSYPCSEGEWNDLAFGIISSINGVGRFYYIQGYGPYPADGFLNVCSNCDGEGYLHAPYDGLLYPTTSMCTWKREPDYWLPWDGTPGAFLGAGVGEINDRHFQGAYLSGSINNWSFSIWCQNELIWSGVKNADITPEGRYDRTGGCDIDTENITLIGIPVLELNACLPGSFSNTYNISITGFCCTGPAGVCGGTVTRVSESLWKTTAGGQGFGLQLESARGGFGGWDITIWDTHDPPILFGLFMPDDSTMYWPRCDPRGLYLGEPGNFCSGDWMVDNHAIVS